MVATFARQIDELEEPLLERLRAKLNRAEQDDRSIVDAPGSSRLLVKLRRVVRNELVALPVGLEDCDELVQDIAVSGRRRPGRSTRDQ